MLSDILGNRRLPLTRGMWVVLRQPDRLVWGQITEIKPDLLVIKPADDVFLERGSKVTMAGLAFGQVPTRVVGTRDNRLLIQRPPAVQLWFRTRRSHRRLPLEVPAILEIGDHPPLNGITEDVSLGGALVLVPGGDTLIASGEAARITLMANEQPIVAECALRFSSTVDGMRHLGVQFLTMDNKDREHLIGSLELLLAGFQGGPS